MRKHLATLIVTLGALAAAPAFGQSLELVDWDVQALAAAARAQAEQSFAREPCRQRYGSFAARNSMKPSERRRRMEICLAGEQAEAGELVADHSSESPR